MAYDETTTQLLRENRELRAALEEAKAEIQWWANEHGCCAGHESLVIERINATLRTSGVKTCDGGGNG